MSVGERILELRKAAGISQLDISRALDISRQAVSKWENDQSCPDIATLPRLADIFGISVDALLGRETVHQGEVIDTDEDEKEKDGIHINNGKWEFHWDSGRRSALTFAFWALLVF